MKKLGKFFAAMFSEWLSGLSGPASVPLAIVALCVSGTLSKVLYGTLAALLGFTSAYRIWLKQYERAEFELALNARPEILPEVLYCFWANTAKYSDYLTTQIFAKLRLTNLRDVDTLVKTYRLTVTTEGKTLGGVNDDTFHYGKLVYDHGLSLPRSEKFLASDTLDIFPMSMVIIPPAPLRKGVHREGWLAFNLNISHVNDYSSPQARITLELTDSFDGKHISKPTDLVIHYAKFIQSP